LRRLTFIDTSPFSHTFYNIFRRVRKTAKSGYYLRHACPLVCLSARNSSAPAGRILIKCYISLFFEKSVKKFHISLTSDKNNGYLTSIPIEVFNNISLNSSKGREVFQTDIVEKIRKHILCSIFFFFENRAFCEIMRKNITKPDTSQMT